MNEMTAALQFICFLPFLILVCKNCHGMENTDSLEHKIQNLTAAVNHVAEKIGEERGNGGKDDSHEAG